MRNLFARTETGPGSGNRRIRNRLIALALVLTSCGVAVFAVAAIEARRIDPFIRRKAIEYLQKRFDGEVEIARLSVQLPPESTLRLLLTQGRGSLAAVNAEGIAVRYGGRRDLPPLFAIRSVKFHVDLGTLFAATRSVPLVELDGLEINVPPKGSRPVSRKDGTSNSPGTSIEVATVRNATLVIFPRQKDRVPLRFDIQDLRLSSLGSRAAMHYEAVLTNPKPPGLIKASGSFGPWNSEEPSGTPLSGDYSFEHADLGVFPGIAGILNSQGHFEGRLDSIAAKGEASVPDFRLKTSGNPVPLVTHFEVLVDGQNGNTVLKPVVARLGSTEFSTNGFVIRNDGDVRRTIGLDVVMPDGDVQDVLRLGMKGRGLMGGRLSLTTHIEVPPLSGKVRGKLRLDGKFAIRNGRFLNDSLRNQIDNFSRKGLGQPGNTEIDDVLFRMEGRFQMRSQNIALNSLRFDVPGADVAMDGTYDLAADQLDFHGILKLQARVSQTMTGWKRWALKPVDPFFAKEGAGTLLHIAVGGRAGSPTFGVDHGPRVESAAEP